MRFADLATGETFVAFGLARVLTKVDDNGAESFGTRYAILPSAAVTQWPMSEDAERAAGWIDTWEG